MNRSAAIALALIAGLHVPKAHATANMVVYQQPAVGNCEAPLPAYDAHLRKRPGGILNEGTTSIYVACGMVSDPLADIDGVWVTFTNRGSVEQTVKCTLVTGQPYAVSQAYTLEAHVPPAPTIIAEPMIFAASELNVDGGPFQSPQALSCVLPPKMEMNTNAVQGMRETSP